MPFQILIAACAWLGASAFGQAIKPVVQADLSHIGDTAHLEFRGLKNWHYELQHDGTNKIVLNVPAIDQASAARLKVFSDPLIKGVAVDANGPDGTYVLTFQLAKDGVESFDYLTDDPSRLIVDFYPKTQPPSGEKKAEAALPSKSGKKSATKPASAHGKKVAAKGKSGAVASRKPAGDEFLSAGDQTNASSSDVGLQFGVFDAADDNYDRFRIKDYEIRDEAIIAARQNIYLPFPMLKMQQSQLEKLMDQQPEYIIHPKDTRENKEARLLQTLFERKRYAVFLKTYDYFMKKHPDSEYAEILKNLCAYVHLARWKETGKPYEFDALRALYGELVQKYPQSPLRERNYLILGYAQMEHGEALATLQTFEGFLNSYPKSPQAPAVHRALAQADLILQKYDDAMNEYNTIIKDFPKTEFAREARYRQGDVFFAKRDFTQAIRAYESAIHELPSQEKTYPNADYNMAEARFWEKDYKNSLNDYVRFLNLFPTHDYGGYALTRIGELLGILGADQRRVMGAFLESYFRFPDHPGALVARVRMLSQQMKGMKEKELDKAVEEINDISDKVDLPGMKEFTTLMTAEGLTHRGQYKDAIEELIAYYQKSPNSTNLPTFRARILRNIANELKDEVDNNQFISALDFYSKYSGNWLKNSDRIDIPYFLGEAYERAGAYGEARKIFTETLQRRERIVGTSAEKEKRVQEHLPSVASLHLRLAAASAADRDYINAYQQLKAIGTGTDLQPAETVERVELVAQIAEQRNDFDRARQALTELAQKWHGDPALVAGVNLKLAQTYNKLSDFEKGESYADKVLSAEGGETKIADATLADAFKAKADAELGQKKSMAAVETYQKLLDRYEGKMPLASIRYKVGDILFGRGDMRGAEDVWAKLQGTRDDLLWKLGKEKLDNVKWMDEYNKYVDRIPAMATDSGKEAAKAADSGKETKP